MRSGRAVSQFRQLCEVADRDRSLTDTLKKVLKLSKGWETAREHVYKAVGTDNRMRCALLLTCQHPLTALLRRPAGVPCGGGVVSGRSLAGDLSVRSVLSTDVVPRVDVRRRARTAWFAMAMVSRRCIITAYMSCSCWFPEGAEAGLLFKCSMGTVDMESPAGLLEPGPPQQPSLAHCTCVARFRALPSHIAKHPPGRVAEPTTGHHTAAQQAQYRSPCWLRGYLGMPGHERRWSRHTSSSHARCTSAC